MLGIFAGGRRPGPVRDIILVDDEPEILDELREYLRMRGFVCDSAGSGAECLSAWERNGPYRLVITDIRMPDMGGLELIRQIRGRSTDVRVLVMTGHAGEAEAEKALGRGAAAVLHKPLDFKTLRKSIDECIGPARG
jgi:DNA-binding NtrC family response regulator